MVSRTTFFALASLMMAGPALAQDAAETAIILSGTGSAQGKAQRSLGSAVAGSVGAAANAVRSSSSRAVRRSTARPAQQMIALPGDVDPLERTDAPTYELSNGASIRVSGGLRRPASAPCEGECPKR